MTDHAACSPSSAAMWMQCPASITLAEGRTRPSSKYAKEGTAAHMIAEMILGGEIFPPGKVDIEGTQFITGMGMLKALRPYLDFVLDLARDADEMHCETRVSIGGDEGIVWGTTDCVALTGTTLDIVDLKYGKGVSVDPDSAQLKIYALAAWSSLWPDKPLRQINLTIVQPRMDAEPKTHRMKVRDLRDWEEVALIPAIRRIEEGDTTEKAGSWCRWCIRKNECQAYASHRVNIAAEIFDDGVDLPE
jgi:Protein of unknown function (DUF2800)